MATARRSTKLDHKDSKIEKILDEHGITFEYRDAVPIAEIERHPDSQSRLRQVDTSRVLSYATAMKEGAVFPPIVVSQDGFDGFRIVDGDGRVSANKRRKITTIPAYVVTLSGVEESVYLSAVFNAQQGQTLTKPERMRAVRAALAIKTNPPSVEQIAKDYNVSRNTIAQIRDGDVVANRLSHLGATDIDRLSQSHLRALSKIVDDAVLVQAAALVSDANMGIRDTGTMLAQINAATSEASRLKVVSDERKDRAEGINAVQSGRTPAGSPVGDSRMVLGRLLALSDHYPDVTKWVPSAKDQRDTWGPKVHAASEFLIKLAAAYDDAVGAVDGDEDDEGDA